MIKIKILSGPHVGTIKEISEMLSVSDIKTILSGLISLEWQYEVDLTSATSEERETWGLALFELSQSSAYLDFLKNRDCSG